MELDISIDQVSKSNAWLGQLIMMDLTNQRDDRALITNIRHSILTNKRNFVCPTRFFSLELTGTGDSSRELKRIEDLR